MSTRCVVNFCDSEGTVCAKVYRHSDGYPGTKHGVMADLRQFFSDVKAQTQDTRFSDPEYLAAKFVVWQALAPISHATDRPLDFLGIGVVLQNPDDIEYEYFVLADAKMPKIRYKEVSLT